MVISPAREKYLSDESIEKAIKALDKENRGCIHLGDSVLVYASQDIIEFYEGNTDLGVCSYKRFANQVRKVMDSWEPVQEAAENTENPEICCENSSEPDDVAYSEIAIRDYLEEEERTLEQYERVNGVEKLPLNLMMRQRMLVKALKLLLESETELDEEETEDMEEDDVPEQPELPVLKNNDQRKEWLNNYKSWGLWYRDENIDVNYYKYDFSDGSRLVVAEYPQREGYWKREPVDEYFFHFLEKNKKKYQSINDVYDEKFRSHTDSETYLVEFLKNLQRGDRK